MVFAKLNFIFSEIYLGTCLYIALYIIVLHGISLLSPNTLDQLLGKSKGVPVRASYYASGPVLQLFKPEAENFTKTSSCSAIAIEVQ